MAQAIFCPACRAFYTAELRGHSCPACGHELIHMRVPARGRPKDMILPVARRAPTASRAMWDHIIRKDPCPYCPTGDRGSTIDHIVPKALGGSKGHWTNRTGSCFRCNQEKAHTPLLFFMLQQCGEDLDWLMDEEGNWPIPERERPELAEVVVEKDTALRDASPREIFPAAWEHYLAAKKKESEQLEDHLQRIEGW